MGWAGRWEGIKVEDRLSHLSPFTFTWGQGAGRLQVTAPEPWPPGLQVNKSEIQAPCGQEKLPILLPSVKVKALSLALIPGRWTCPLPCGGGLHFRAWRLTLLRFMTAQSACLQEGQTPGGLTNKKPDSRSGTFNPEESGQEGVRVRVWGIG